MNTIFTIRPYKIGQTWFFDDKIRKIQQEAFVGNINRMIDEALLDKYGTNVEEGFCLLFSDEFIPDAQCLEFLEHEGNGAWYQWRKKNLKGWLCRCLFEFFPKAPNRIYFKIQK